MPKDTPRPTKPIPFEELQEQFGGSPALKLANAMAGLFEHFPLVSLVTVKGSTPVWNDGDACTHSQDHWVDGVSGKWSGGYVTPEFRPVYIEDYVSDHGDGSLPEVDRIKQEVSANPDRAAQAKEFHSFLGKLTPLFVSAWQTNFVARFWRAEDGSMLYAKHDYEPE